MTFEQAAAGLDAVADAAPGIVRDGMAGLASEVLAAVVADWPVDSGESLAGWEATGGIVRNEVEYTSEVHDGLADRLIREAEEAAGEAAMAEVARQLADLGGFDDQA